MDIVKKELLMKRKNLSEETGGRKVFKRSEIKQKRILKLREEDKRDSESKLESTMPKPEFGASSSSKANKRRKNVDTLNLPKEEVIRQLRFLKQPVTLFREVRMTGWID
ncbi:hypothetical protein QVD17_35717 [Tagetes erecta]|uniref:Uncharacterized protein n=1 Tax=Tagetes erecta TaxID=13708 RepID=A0AAD8JRA6_TARER|nr:hypothetical protein QVD17_35717 [Tagetes erecta]